ncbi:imidazole glycerol phosphate synthase subunit HisF [Pyruvatibacter mobilis]|uniref:Imidazole glycerol phosphate synthase subunit HisF n=1 Tax=Pyruvatibacter mobilis TaxID=1712261 RepID=A0A845Q7J9_9HYPH|nr:AglZ/HisF2 family acetamidino modification protein [Pyruvatibacter mobilis]NBG94394.1 imidazole glycerol phosphate synthase subunit HisF [Pyruvatibacter mobilis]QJD76681.1 imidazole glycerol phosphate synthase subunit HisF [Pyruvatibacter mobilis]GGD02617.1 putative imidazole glycerol phosphate synthase subunit hisF2 [Pyruvatibacter mobilis]
MKTRVIPVLLLQDDGLVKTTKFKNPRYVGDPINSVRIFNEKEVDELIFLDIGASLSGRGPTFELLERIAGEAFMPMAYGGGLTNLKQVKTIFSLGFEKVVLNSTIFSNPKLIEEIVKIFGAQAVVACVDVRRSLFGRHTVYSHGGRTKQQVKLVPYLKALEEMGVGEVMIQSVDRDGTMAGYDIEITQIASQNVSMPVIACGGAGSLEHFVDAVTDGSATAVAAGSMFVYKGVHRAVLINYPPRQSLKSILP